MAISFDNLIQRTREVALAAGKVAGDVVGDVVDTSKAKLAEAKLTSEIQEVTERLGSIVYEAAKTGRDSIKLQEMLIAELDDLNSGLEQLRQKNAAGKAAPESTICAACGEKNALSAVFCAKCGERIIVDICPTEYAVEAEITEPETAEETPAEEKTEE